MEKIFKQALLIKLFLILISFVMMIFIALFLEYFLFDFPNVVFSKKHIFIYLFIYLIALAFIVFGGKKIFEFLHKYRFLIAAILFALCVFFEINTSSSGIYNVTVQESINVHGTEPVWGTLRTIRSDEFVGSTPTLLSQALDSTFSSFNDRIMATESCLLLQPKVTCFDISVLASPQLWGFFFLDSVRGFSFHNMLYYFASFLVMYEFLLLVTKKKRLLSLCGTCLIVFSPIVLWWNCQAYLIFGFLCILIFNKLIVEKRIINVIVLSVLLGWSFACFTMLLYPAWMFPYGYLYLIFVAWFIYKNRQKLIIKNFLFLLISASIVCILVLPALIQSKNTFELLSNSVYPGARDEGGGEGWEMLFNWWMPVFYGFKNVYNNTANVCEWSQYISFFPFPILAGILVICYDIKKRKFDLLLILLTLYAVLLSIWNFIPIGIFSKITFLNISTPQRSANVVGLVCIFILIRLFDLNFRGILSKQKGKICMTVVAIFSIIISFVASYSANLISENFNILFIYILFIVYSFILITLILGVKQFFIYSLALLGLICCLSVQPLCIGLNAIYDKPLSHEIQSEVGQNYDDVWASVNSDLYYMSNFALSNGARVLNSVNYYPNIQLWERLDPTHQYESIYNRYAHVSICLTNNNTNFQLTEQDAFLLNLNINDIKKLDINKILSKDNELNRYNNNSIKFTKLYEEYGTSIYNVEYY